MREVCWDLETTGVNIKEDRIVEIAAVELMDYLPTGRVFQRYVNPEKHVGFSEKIHKLSDWFLRDQPLFRDVVDDFLAFVGDAPLIAHNAKFDMGVLASELKRLGRELIQNVVIDTMELAKAVKDPRKKGRSGLTLDALCSRFKVDTKARANGHGALVDSQLLAAVYLGLRGGRQHGMALTPEVAKVAAPVATYGPRTFVSRITADEIAAHRMFLALEGDLKQPLWLAYGQGEAHGYR